MTKVAINGFGRIGRLVARAILERDDLKHLVQGKCSSFGSSNKGHYSRVPFLVEGGVLHILNQRWVMPVFYYPFSITLLYFYCTLSYFYYYSRWELGVWLALAGSGLVDGKRCSSL